MFGLYGCLVFAVVFLWFCGLTRWVDLLFDVVLLVIDSFMVCLVV